MSFWYCTVSIWPSLLQRPDPFGDDAEPASKRELLLVHPRVRQSKAEVGLQLMGERRIDDDVFVEQRQTVGAVVIVLMIATAAWDERAPDIKGRSSMEPNKQRDYELTWTPVGAALQLTTNCAGTFCAQATPPSAMAAAASNPQRAMR